MGIEDKAQDLGGRAKEAAGSMADDDELKAEGEADQTKAAMKDKLEDAKDKIEDKIDDAL